MAKKFRYQHIVSNVENKVPVSLLDGEIAVNQYNGKERLFIKNSVGEIIPFIPEHTVSSLIDTLLDKIEELSAITEDAIERAMSAETMLAEYIESLSGDVKTLIVGMIEEFKEVYGEIETLSSSTSSVESDLNILSSSTVTLSSNVNTLSSSIVALSGAAVTIESNLENEIVRAMSAETILDEHLTELSGSVKALSVGTIEEFDNVYGEVGVLSSTTSAISVDVQALSSSTVVISGNLDTEIIRAQSAETILQANIDSVSADVTTFAMAQVREFNEVYGEIATLSSSTSNEIIRAESAETVLNEYVNELSGGIKTLGIATGEEFKEAYNDINTVSSSTIALSAGTFTTFNLKPVTIYETDGSTGLSGVNSNTMDLNTWQLENLDFSPYKYVIAYFKQANLAASSTYATPSVMCHIPLDDASKSTQYNAYIGGAGATNMNDRDIHFQVLCAIDSTKTKFKVLSEHSVAGTVLGERNGDGRYCYKIVGYYE